MNASVGVCAWSRSEPERDKLPRMVCVLDGAALSMGVCVVSRRRPPGTIGVCAVELGTEAVAVLPFMSSCCWLEWLGAVCCSDKGDNAEAVE